MRFVVKLGGVALEDKKILHAAGKAIADLVADGNQVAVVHGGGVQLTRTLAQMGKKSEFISGLRVTDADPVAPYGEKLVLSRPDQHVAWRGDVVPDNPLRLVDKIRGAA